MKNHQPAVKVLVTGVFDLLHQEHQIFLQKAKQLGDYLVIGVESDRRVREIKGESRPILPAVQRVANLQKLGLADEIFILPEQFSKPADHLALIKKVNPQILAVSSHTAHLDKKQAIMAVVGGKVVIIHEHNPQISTTILANRRRKKTESRRKKSPPSSS